MTNIKTPDGEHGRTYKVILDGLRGFGVEVTAPDGFRSVRGFPTEAAPLPWIAEQEAREANAVVIPT
jgi:hypothetical protein